MLSSSQVPELELADRHSLSLLPRDSHLLRDSPPLKVSNNNSQNSSSSNPQPTEVVSQAQGPVPEAQARVAAATAQEMETQGPGLAANHLPSSEI